jgi:hypothetical protein
MANALVVHTKRLPQSRKMHRAAQYVRMSTDYQQYSIENQAVVIATYAELHRGSSTAAHGPGRKLTRRRRSSSGADWSAAASLCYGNAIVPMFFHRPRGARLWIQEQPMAMHRWRSANRRR